MYMQTIGNIGMPCRLWEQLGCFLWTEACAGYFLNESIHFYSFEVQLFSQATDTVMFFLSLGEIYGHTTNTVAGSLPA